MVPTILVKRVKLRSGEKRLELCLRFRLVLLWFLGLGPAVK